MKKRQLEIPEELFQLLSHATDVSSLPTWTLQAGAGFTTIKLTWQKDKKRPQTKKDRTLKRRGDEITRPPTRDIDPGPSIADQKRTLKRRGGEITHSPARVIDPVSTSAVPDPPETAPAQARPKQATRQTPCRYRRNQRRYWEWRNRTRKGPLVGAIPECHSPMETAPTSPAVGEPPTSLLPSHQLYYCRLLDSYALFHHHFRYNYSPASPLLITPDTSQTAVGRDPRFVQIIQPSVHHLNHYQQMIRLLLLLR